jgi:hypothetical protein
LGQVAEWLKARAWRAGEGNPKLETEFTLFTEDRTILPRLETPVSTFPYLIGTHP